MTLQLIKSLGLDSLGLSQIVLLLTCQMLVILAVAFYADELAPSVGFGALGNALILFLSLWAGLAAYAHFINPLRYATTPVFLAVAVGSAVLGLLAMMVLLRRPYRV